jgi:hypothetical protein
VVIQAGISPSFQLLYGFDRSRRLGQVGRGTGRDDAHVNASACIVLKYDGDNSVIVLECRKFTKPLLPTNARDRSRSTTG